MWRKLLFVASVIAFSGLMYGPPRAVNLWVWPLAPSWLHKDGTSIMPKNGFGEHKGDCRYVQEAPGDPNCPGNTVYTEKRLLTDKPSDAAPASSSVYRVGPSLRR